ncbi:MAG: pyruvate ferredoxin oxidoreductase, partial [Candidatus Marinimicrobia bacterium]|nr:pyruvate ferredoxin oxidoreductase [Candidatus Neomarinimicrobiota bacterium]
TVKIAKDISSQPDLIQRMQGIVLLGIFLKATPFLDRSGISEDELMISVEQSLRKYFGKRGEQVVKDNLNCVKRGFKEVFEVKQPQTEKEEVLV